MGECLQIKYKGGMASQKKYTGGMKSKPMPDVGLTPKPTNVMVNRILYYLFIFVAKIKST